jgi:hypothetical protein
VQAAMNECNMENKNLKGHRERVRSRLLKGEILPEEQLLELLLMYGIPQKDVRPLAKELLAEYGTLEAVLDTDYKILIKKSLIKENTAALFRLIKVIINRHNCKRSIHKTAESEQVNFFGSLKDKENKLPHTPPGKNIQFFANAVTRDSLEILPQLPETQDISALTVFIRNNLHYNSEESRHRYANYVVKRLFPSGKVDLALIRFGHSFVNTQDLRDVCFYRYLHAEPLLRKTIEDLIVPAISRGFIKRDEIVQYVDTIFPGMKSNRKCVLAIVDVLVKTNICKLQKQEITFRNRKPNVASFVYILHSEFQEPGMYDSNLLKNNPYITAMLWDSDCIDEILYDLRNYGYISKVSNIDGIKQFTTKYHLAEITEILIGRKGQE